MNPNPYSGFNYKMQEEVEKTVNTVKYCKEVENYCKYCKLRVKQERWFLPREFRDVLKVFNSSFKEPGFKLASIFIICWIL